MAIFDKLLWSALCEYIDELSVQYMYFSIPAHLYFDGLVQERHNSSVLAMELHISCSNPLIWVFILCDKFCMLPFLVCPCNKFPVVPDISLSLLSATVQNETIRPMATAQGFYPNSLTVRSVFRLLPIWFIHGQMNWGLMVQCLEMSLVSCAVDN